MTLIELLKAAKLHLQTEALESSKMAHICFAIRNTALPKGVSMSEDMAMAELAEAAYDIVQARLKTDVPWSNGVYFTIYHTTLILDGKAVYRAVTPEERQTARHLWLDQLIKELEK